MFLSVRDNSALQNRVKTQKKTKKIQKHGIYKNPEDIAVWKAVNTDLGVKVTLDFGLPCLTCIAC